MEDFKIKSKQEVINGNIELAIISSQTSLTEFTELLNAFKGTNKEALIEPILNKVAKLQSYFEQSLHLIKTELAGVFEFQEKEFSKIQEGFNQKMEEYKMTLRSNSQEELKKLIE